MNASTRIALILGPAILVISLLQSAGSSRKVSAPEKLSNSKAVSLKQSLEQSTAESSPTLSESVADSLDHAQSGVVRESLPQNIPSRLKGPLHERLFPKSRIISEEQIGPNEEGIITRIQLLETDFKYSLIRLEQRWKGDEPLPPVAMVANHVMIERKEGMSDLEFRKAIEDSGLKIDKMLPDSDVYIVSFNAKDAHSIDAVLENLKNSADSIGAAEPDFIRFVN